MLFYWFKLLLPQALMLYELQPMKGSRECPVCLQAPSKLNSLIPLPPALKQVPEKFTFFIHSLI
jgi:hypothetical protein